MDALQATPLGAVLDTLGIDPALITAIANGDPAAIGMLADRFGIQPVIIEVLIASVMKDVDGLKEAIPKLAGIPGIDLDPEVASTFTMLAWKTSEANLSTAIKGVIVQFGRFMRRKLAKGEGLSTLPLHSLPNVPPEYAIDPRMIEALISMSRGNVRRVLTLARNSAANDLFPKGVFSLLDFVDGLVRNDGDAIERFLEIFKQYVDPEIADAVGCLVSEGY
jgi:hypothetical protein